MSIQDSGSSDDSIELKKAKKKREQSMKVTPYEEKLIAELEALPKPKRNRKHKRKKSEKNEKQNSKKVSFNSVYGMHSRSRRIRSFWFV